MADEYQGPGERLARLTLRDAPIEELRRLLADAEKNAPSSGDESADLLRKLIVEHIRRLADEFCQTFAGRIVTIQVPGDDDERFVGFRTMVEWFAKAGGNSVSSDNDATASEGGGS